MCIRDSLGAPQVGAQRDDVAAVARPECGGARETVHVDRDRDHPPAVRHSLRDRREQGRLVFRHRHEVVRRRPAPLEHGRRERQLHRSTLAANPDLVTLSAGVRRVVCSWAVESDQNRVGSPIRRSGLETQSGREPELRTLSGTGSPSSAAGAVESAQNRVGSPIRRSADRASSRARDATRPRTRSSSLSERQSGQPRAREAVESDQNRVGSVARRGHASRTRPAELPADGQGCHRDFTASPWTVDP